MGFLFGLAVDNSVWCGFLGSNLGGALDALITAAVATFFWNPVLSADFVVLAAGCAFGIGSTLGYW